VTVIRRDNLAELDPQSVLSALAESSSPLRNRAGAGG
jgi:hypothetical protein